MATDDRYDTRLDDKYGQLSVIDIPGEVAAHQPWFNQTLTRVNDCVVRLGIIEGEYHWHRTITRTSASSCSTASC